MSQHMTDNRIDVGADEVADLLLDAQRVLGRNESVFTYYSFISTVCGATSTPYFEGRPLTTGDLEQVLFALQE